MKKVIMILVSLVFAFGCSRQPEPFRYTLRGTIVGQESGVFYLMGSPRMGDEIEIAYENYSFEYTGTSPFMFTTVLFPDARMEQAFPVVIEPGEIVLQLNLDALQEESEVLAGDYNRSIHKAQQEFQMKFAGMDFMADETRRGMNEWMLAGPNTYLPIMYLSSWETFYDFMPLYQLQELLQSVEDPMLKNSKEHIELYSIWLAKKDSVNAVGQEAVDFRLPDSKGRMVRFQEALGERFTFVEKSGSWCGNTTRNSRALLPVYEEYKDKGLEIISIVPESNHERWLQWLEEEQLPWINLVEQDSEVATRKISLSHWLFNEGSYLADASGTVIAKNLSAADLKEWLMKYFEPEQYEHYLAEKWEMPDKIFILDKEQPVTSFEALLENMQGRPFMIDCWATWCSPCFEEFAYNEPLKKLLQTMGVEMVYISFDRPEDEAIWLKTIREQNLTGYHFRLNNEFQGNLGMLGFSGTLPAYMIVNARGEVVVQNAYRPSQTHLLYDQLQQALQ